ncbi:N2227-like [Trema orientale]|uniref:carnosine N-methyltransferase n=1 Tax=Trema orientale TaxID=63057 RepID=A0A2P5ERA2_TREOI|nr:N2227-like [Trema orientale]
MGRYPDAADEDVKRYEKSFKKLPPAHKALLSHYLSKFQKLRRCISVNSYFIFSMLQAFEPPLDMSQDIDICENLPLEDAPNNHCSSETRDVNCSHSTSTSGRNCFSKSNEAFCEEGSNLYNSPKGVVANKEVENEGQNASCNGCNPGLEYDKEMGTCCGNDAIDSNGNASFSNHEWLDPSIQFNVPLVDVDKVRCIVRNIVRDWAAEGQKERDQCYKPILEELDVLFPNRSKESPPACLVPGAGLGRLALEISRLDSDQLRPVSIPDIHPASAGITEGFSMCGGDFVEVYSDPSQAGVWDVVVTCFFIDTAHNIVEYIEIISKILKDGGVWINLGPLLYHFADMYGQEDEMSIELSLEDVKRVALHYGFQFEKEKTIETTYTTNYKSMMQNRYYAAFWTARKKSPAAGEHAHE